MYLYLAGPITGLTLKAANDWREDDLMLASLAKHGYVCLNPLREKEHLGAWENQPLPARYTPEQEEFEVSHDLDDINKSCAILANFKDAQRVSIGSVWELGYANAKGKPVVSVLEPGGLHDHLFIHNTSYKVVESMFEAVAELAILAPKLREPQYA
jgi:nucleoside 2-deoxyribosyltransferase